MLTVIELQRLKFLFFRHRLFPQMFHRKHVLFLQKEKKNKKKNRLTKNRFRILNLFWQKEIGISNYNI
jgi:hypothetical protein